MNILTRIIIFFIIAQLIGIYTGLVILGDMTANPYVKGLVLTADTESPLNAVVFVLYVLIGAVFILFVIRYFKFQLLLFRMMEFFLIASATSIVFYALWRNIATYETATFGGILCGMVFAALKFFKDEVKNGAAILATAGVGVIFGVSLGIVPAIIFLIVLSVYDYLAVFFTKHMVEIAQHVIKNNLAFTITARKPGHGTEKESRVDLGTGDLIAPVMLEVTTLSYNPIATVFVFISAVLSLGIFLFVVWKKKTVLPALPPIVSGMLLSLFIGYLLGFY